MSYLHGKFVWFEHMSADVPKARIFYGKLFGWGSDGIPMGQDTYHMVSNGGQGIGGFRTAPPAAPSMWMSYLSVPDVDACVRAAQAAGARVLMAPTDFPTVGRGATLADPCGAVFSVWKAAQGDRADVDPVAVGDWYWNECMATDERLALDFYQRVFAFTSEAMDMGAMGKYHILSAAGRPRAGLMRNPDGAAPSAWVPYVRVADCDASLRSAADLGARVCVPATDIPNVGRFGVLMDPLGAVIAVIRSARDA